MVKGMNDDAGFTLLELLVAVALMALIAVPASLAVSMGIDTWKSTNKAVEDAEYIMLVRASLRRWIGSAYPFDVNRVAGEQTFPLNGSENRLVISTPLNSDASVDALYRLSLSWDTDSQNLEFKFAVDLGADLDEQAAQTLLTEIEEFEVSYLSLNSEPFLPTWEASWQAKYSLPAAVRIKAKFTNPKLRWEELVIPLQVVDWAHCEFDEVSRECRTGADAG